MTGDDELRQWVGQLVTRDVLAAVKGVGVTVKVLPEIEGIKRLKPLTKVSVIKAANRAAKPSRASVEAHARSIHRYGYLGKSIGTKTKVYSTGAIATVIGPKMSYSRVKGKRKRGPDKGQSIRHRPYLYSWLLERGTKRSKARPFIRPSLLETGAAYRDGLTRELAAEFEKLLS